MLEALVALVIFLGMASVLVTAVSYAIYYHQQARLLHEALLQSVQILDEALYAHKSSGNFSYGPYSIMLERLSNTNICRITTSWKTLSSIKTIHLISYRRQEHL